MNMTAPHSRNVGGRVNLNVCGLQPLQERFIVTTPQRWMRLFRGPKIILYAKMNLHPAALEPAAAALCQFRWLWNLCHAQQMAIKPPRVLFFPWRHGKLYVIDCDERMYGHKLIQPSACRGNKRRA